MKHELTVLDEVAYLNNSALVGALVRHFRTNTVYVIKRFVLNTTSDEVAVMYATDNKREFTRDLPNFTDYVDDVPRFTFAVADTNLEVDEGEPVDACFEHLLMLLRLSNTRFNKVMS